jgi:small subunit ribosomal protein S16
MALRVRLRRGGSKGYPCYSVVVADSSVPRDGKFIEKLGTYQPMLAKDHSGRFLINQSRLAYWFDVGAYPTDSLLKLLVRSGAELPERMRAKWEIKLKAWADAPKKQPKKPKSATS